MRSRTMCYLNHQWDRFIGNERRHSLIARWEPFSLPAARLAGRSRTMERRNAILSLVIAAIIIVGFLIGFLYADMGWRTSPLKEPLNKTKVETPRPTPRLRRVSRRIPKRIPRCRISNSSDPSGRNTNRGAHRRRVG
ncbi:hypothetical protein BQ8482_210004 [Mesorhizobium delmotii]|uniref:Uncharacterized protein n=1 Tax=Mesorhizobium delmotii TaxID=1631247 RepID=A0A2P9AKY8_9HYPH|nr:hypothetical protein BQ8482_210004 [Mesorhizobium delmotii]